MKIKVAVLLILTSSFLRNAHGGSATWNLSPTNNSWGTASNWTPATVPNGGADVATFDASNTTTVSLGIDISLDSIVFNPGASSFTFSASGKTVTIGGLGIVNHSGVTQTFANMLGSYTFLGTASADDANFTINQWLFFEGSASAGRATITNNPIMPGADFGQTIFSGDATAENAIITNKGAGGSNGIFAGYTSFHDNATAASAIITNEGGLSDFLGGGGTSFIGGDGGNATLISNGGSTAEAYGGLTEFSRGSSAGNATLIANGSPFVNPGGGGEILFSYDSDGGTARVMVFGNGSLSMITHDKSPVTIGSIEGDGLIRIGSHLIVGSNNRSSIFSDRIASEGGEAGTLTKIGRGMLALTDGNTFTGGVTVRRGVLLVNNATGSGTGPGPVEVEGGALGGNGFIGGPVTVGVGGSQRASLVPGRDGLGVLTMQSTLIFGANGTYNWNVDTVSLKSDGIAANGVTISVGALFSIFPAHRGTIPIGTVFTVVDNQAVTSISGTFSNLPDGGTILIGNNNTFQANYEGGDGNDLTLTVVP